MPVNQAILFGSNDACFPDANNGQHVPLDVYKENLVKLVTHPAVEAHKPRLILITPPPVEERRLEHRVKSQGYTKLNRSNIQTKQYADAAREVAEEMNVGCLESLDSIHDQGRLEGRPASLWVNGTSGE